MWEQKRLSITWFVLFDQGGFEDQGLFFGRSQDRFNRGRFFQHYGRLGEFPGFRSAVRGETIPQITSFADIKNSTGLALHQVNTGCMRD